MSCQYMSNRLVVVVQELRDYLGPEARGLSDEDVVHTVMCQALEYQLQWGELKSKEKLRQGEPRR